MIARIRTLAAAILILVGLAACVQAWWQVIAAPNLLSRAEYDRHRQLAAGRVRPGDVYAGHEAVLRAVKTNGGWTYRYEQPRLYCCLTGYSDQTGMRRAVADALLARGRYAGGFLAQLSPHRRGCDVYLTIDPSIQRVCSEALAGRCGGAVVIRVSDAAVVALVSKPEYDPARVTASSAEWQLFINDPDEPWLVRPLQKRYAPGAFMHFVTALAYLRAGLDPQARFGCPGTDRVCTVTAKCERAHGSLSLPEALAAGCRVAIAKAAAAVGPAGLRDAIKALHLLDRAGVGIPSMPGGMPPLNGPRAERHCVMAALGIPPTRITPFSAARFLLTLARGGEVVQPRLLSKIVNSSGEVVEEFPARSLGRAAAPEQAAELLRWLEAASLESGGSSRIYAWFVPQRRAGLLRPRGTAWAAVVVGQPTPSYVAVLVEEGAEELTPVVGAAGAVVEALEKMPV